MFGVLNLQLRIPYWRKKEMDISFNLTAHPSYLWTPAWPSLTFWKNQYERGATLRLWFGPARLFFKIDFTMYRAF
jgi:hypothetical protein